VRELLLILSFPPVAYGISVFAGTWAVRKFGGWAKYELPYPSWNQAFNYALAAETAAFLTLQVVLLILKGWQVILPEKVDVPGFSSMEILWLWLCAIMISNSVELLVLRAGFNIYPRPALVTCLGIVNAFCAWPEMAVALNLL
jgi:hypothetical protein